MTMNCLNILRAYRKYKQQARNMSKVAAYSDTNSDDDDEFLASYVDETFVYSRHGVNYGKPRVEIELKIAGSTRGRNIISQNMDNTGIFVWPASHLMCYYLSSLSPDESLGSVCELGCGVGLVGITAVLCKCVNSYLFTDGDPMTLALCEENIALNLPDTPDIEYSASLLKFGGDLSGRSFDTLIGADIIYPTITYKVIDDLFRTADQILRKSSHNKRYGSFLLSFVSRDGYRTPQRFIEVATSSCYSIHFEADESTIFGSNINRANHVFMGAKIFRLRKDPNAAYVNERLGGTDCKLFPGLNDAIRRAQEESSDSEWEAPGFSDDSVDENHN